MTDGDVMVFVIAEAGVNHNGDMCLAEKLVDAAYSAGADAVKFQAFTPERLDPPGARRDMLKKLALGRDAFARLFEHCEQIGIEFMATPFDVEWLDFLVDLGVRRIKLSSASIGDSELIHAAFRSKLPVILSTGMASEQELINACCVLHDTDLTLLHCVSAYPTPVRSLNLRRIKVLMLAFKKFGVEVGLSDHSTSIYPAIASVALGATVIEKHLTLDHHAVGPDHISSLEPAEFSAMVAGIGQVEMAMGDGKLFGPVAVETSTSKIKRERDEWRNSSLEMADTPAA